MKTLSRILSLIICFQLMVGCNQVSTSSGTIKTKAPGSSDTMTISGSIASTIHHLTNLIIPNAMAADGTLILYDISNTNAEPVEIDRWEISGETYSIKAKKSLAQDKILKLSFESNDPDKNREILIDASGSVNSIEAPINPEEYFKSKIFESQLKSEFSGFTGNIKEIKARFSAMKGESFESELALLGSNNEILKMINSGNSSYISDMANLIHNYRLAKDDTDRDNYKTQLLDIGKNLGVIDESGIIEETPAIKDNQAILKCSGNEGAFIFNDDQLFNVFATSEDPDFINQYQGASYFGSIKSSDEAQESIKKLISNLTEISKAYSRNISARINFVGFDGKELTFNSCQLSGLPMSAEELDSIKDSSSGVIFDESFLKSVPLEKIANYEEGARSLDEMNNKTIVSLKNLLTGVEDIISNALMENQIPLIKALNESRLGELKDFFSSPKISTLDMEKLSTDDVGDFDSSYSILREMYNKALYNLVMKISSDGIDQEQARKILDEQILVANAVFEKRVSEFFEKFQPLKQPEYRLDLSHIQGLSFDGVGEPYALAKDTLEKSVKRYQEELMNQKVDGEIINTVIEEQRNYGYTYIKLRIDEHAYHGKMLEILASLGSEAAARSAASP
jgi:hypothetical protein